MKINITSTVNSKIHSYIIVLASLSLSHFWPRFPVSNSSVCLADSLHITALLKKGQNLVMLLVPGKIKSVVGIWSTSVQLINKCFSNLHGNTLMTQTSLPHPHNFKILKEFKSFHNWVQEAALSLHVKLCIASDLDDCAIINVK